MDDAERYQREFDQLMREAEAKAHQVETQQREEIWHGLRKSFHDVAEAQNWSTKKREAAKKYLLDHFLDFDKA